jgi:hypothetical protein
MSAPVTDDTTEPVTDRISRLRFDALLEHLGCTARDISQGAGHTNLLVSCPSYEVALVLAECVRARGGHTGAVFGLNRLIVSMPTKDDA